MAIAEQQQVEIARALKDKSRILVMDEPTAALSDRETEQLFEVIRKLRHDGIAIIYISHRMEKIYALADRISVLRDGQYVGSLTREEISPQRLVQMMVGRSMQDFYEHQRQTKPGPVMLEVRNISDGRKVQPASFQIRAGEILGLAGLVGAGRTEVSRLIFGADPKVSGEVWLNGKKLEINSPSDAIAAGLGYVPEDRKDQGLFLERRIERQCGQRDYPRKYYELRNGSNGGTSIMSQTIRHRNTGKQQKSRQRRSINNFLQVAGILPILVLICILFAFLSPNFLTAGNAVNILRQASINIVLATGMFNNKIRGAALSVAAAMQWVANFAVFTTFPTHIAIFRARGCLWSLYNGGGNLDIFCCLFH